MTTRAHPLAQSFAPMPEPPYMAVIFTAHLREEAPGYAAMAEEMGRLAEGQPGYIGIESTRGADGLGITVSYWRDEAALIAWKQEVHHLAAQRLGRERWYSHYALRIARVERQYDGPEGR